MFLEKKNVLLTGAAGGIGWGIARECARQGACIALTDIDKHKGEQVLADVLKLSEGHQYFDLDLLKTDDFTNRLSHIEEVIGKIDILFNNAAFTKRGSFLKVDEGAWDRTEATNVKGHMFLSQQVAKRMIKNKKKGSIVFTTSIHQETIQGRPHYSTSKAALKMLVKEMAVELAPHHIRVNGISPGSIDISKRTEDTTMAKKDEEVILGGHKGLPIDIGRTAVFLASDYWSGHITGEVIQVDGGQAINRSLVRK